MIPEGNPHSYVYIYIYIYVCIYIERDTYISYKYGMCKRMYYINIYTYIRLQLKRGLFWYRHHPKMHEMVSDRSSRAENLTDLRKISMRVFFNSKKCGKMTIWSKKTQKCRFSWKKIFEKLHGPYQSWKKQIFRYNLLKLN